MKTVRIFSNPKEETKIVDVVNQSDEMTNTLRLSFLNTSDRKLLSVTVIVEPDIEDQPGQTESFGVWHMDLGKEEVFQADPIAFDAPLDVSGNLSVRILSQTFEDGVVENDLSEQKPYELYQLSEGEKERLRRKYGQDAFLFSSQQGTDWFCICGNINTIDEGVCLNCGRKKSTVLRKMTPTALAKFLDSDSTNVVPTGEEATKASSLAVNSEARTGKNGKAILLTALLTAALCVALGYFCLRYRDGQIAHAKEVHIAELVKSAEQAEAKDDYDEASKLYATLLAETKEASYEEKLVEVRELRNQKHYYEEGKRMMEAQDNLGALGMLAGVTAENLSFYEDARISAEAARTGILKTAQGFLDEENYGAATFVTLELLKKDAAYEPALEMMQAIQTKKTTRAEEIRVAQEEAAAKAKEESELIEELKKDLEEANEKLKAAQGQADISSLSSKLKNSIQFVSTSRANVRSGGTGSAGIIAKVAKGSAISVTNTKIEGTQRVWCYGQVTDAVTGKAVYGWLSSEVLTSRRP